MNPLLSKILVLVVLLALNLCQVHAGVIVRIFYHEIPGNAVSDLLNAPHFPNGPNPSGAGLFTEIYTNEFAGLGPNNADDYGSWIRAYIEAPETGNYIFFLRSDDGSELRLSTDHTAANLRRIAFEADCCDPLFANDPDTKSAPIALERGKKYFVEVFHKEGIGDDYIEVGWQRPDGRLERIPGRFMHPLPLDPVTFQAKQTAPVILSGPFGPFGDGLAVEIQGQPQNLTIIEGRPATFEVTTEATQPATFQWKRNAIDIPGAILSSYTIDFPTMADNAATFSVEIQNALGSVTSSAATLTVTPDTTVPVVLSARPRDIDPNIIDVVFNERMGTPAVSNFSINNSVTINSAALSADGQTIVVNASGIKDGVTNYEITITGAKDFAGNAAATTTLPLRLFPVRTIDANGLVVMEAENPDLNTPQGLHSWIFTDTTTDLPSGKGAMYAFPDDPVAVIDNPAMITLSPRLDFRVNFTKTGTYYVWYRGSDGGGDSLHVGINNTSPNATVRNIDFGPIGDCCGPRSVPNGTEWTWMNGTAAGAANRSMLSIASIGVHTINVWMREDGQLVDKLLLIPDINFTLTDPEFGPAETPVTDFAFPDAKIEITAQPANATRTERQTATFSVTARALSGTTVLGANNIIYQWQRDGVDIPGAIGPSVTTAALKIPDSGAKFRVLLRIAGARTLSQEATLTVNADVTPPTIVFATGSPFFTNVTVNFSEPVDSSATNAANFQISGLSVTRAVAGPSGTNVILTTSRQTEGTKYTLTVNNIKDIAATPNTIAANSQTTFTGWILSKGGLIWQSYNGIGGTAVQGLFDDPKFPNAADETLFMSRFDSRTVRPDNSRNNYGARMFAFFVPDRSGEWRFFLRSDDASQLFLSPDSDPDKKVVIAEELDCCDAFTDDATAAAPISLVAGTRYYIEAILKEGGGDDWLKVAVKGPGEDLTVPPPSGAQGSVNPETIPGNFLVTFVDPDGVSVSITRQPVPVTVEENRPATFSVVATGTSRIGASPLYQWQKNGVDIPGAIISTFTIPRAQKSDEGKYRVVVSMVNQSVTSTEVTLTVNADVTPPTLGRVLGSASLDTVTVRFSEEIAAAGAADVANYTITGPAGALSVTAATFLPDNSTVVLTTAPQTRGAKYSLTVNNIKDIAVAQNPIAPNSLRVFFGLGTLSQTADGLIVTEAENFDTSTDEGTTDFWQFSTERPGFSGVGYMIIPNGSGGGNPNAGALLNFDVNFTKTGTHYMWILASATGPAFGNDDSVFPGLDGQVIPGAGNQRVLTGFGTASWVWRNTRFEALSGSTRLSFDVPTTGMHTINIWHREDGALFDKLLLTTDPNLTPAGFGPEETRSGAPPAPTVAITSPGSGATFATGASVTITADAAHRDGIDRVDFFQNSLKVGEDKTGPFSLTLNNVAEGRSTITAVATDVTGNIAISAPVQIVVGQPVPKVLFVTGEPTLNAADSAIKARLESFGFQVETVEDIPSRTSDAFDKALIVISSTVNSGDVNIKYRDLPIPVINWEEALEDDFGMTGNTADVDRGGFANQTAVNIVNATHPMAAGLPTGVRTVVTAATSFNWGAPNANATVIATLADNPARSTIYVYDKGKALVSNLTAAEKRIMIFLNNDSFLSLNEDGNKLFDAAVQYALPGVGGPPPVMNVSLQGANVMISWTGAGTLEAANEVTGPWAPITGATSPHQVTATGSARFFRIQR